MIFLDKNFIHIPSPKETPSILRVSDRSGSGRGNMGRLTMNSAGGSQSCASCAPSLVTDGRGGCPQARLQTRQDQSKLPRSSTCHCPLEARTQVGDRFCSRSLFPADRSVGPSSLPSDLLYAAKSVRVSIEKLKTDFISSNSFPGKSNRNSSAYYQNP